MKALTFALALFASAVTFADSESLIAEDRQADKIAEALDLPYADVTPEGLLGSQHLRKDAGALNCNQTVPVVPRPRPAFNCRLNDRATQKELAETYNTLGVASKKVNGLDSTLYVKKIGRLTCTKDFSTGGVDYRCSVR